MERDSKRENEEKRNYSQSQTNNVENTGWVLYPFVIIASVAAFNS